MAAISADYRRNRTLRGRDVDHGRELTSIAEILALTIRSAKTWNTSVSCSPSTAGHYLSHVSPNARKADGPACPRNALPGAGFPLMMTSAFAAGIRRYVSPNGFGGRLPARISIRYGVCRSRQINSTEYVSDLQNSRRSCVASPTN